MRISTLLTVGASVLSCTGLPTISPTNTTNTTTLATTTAVVNISDVAWESRIDSARKMPPGPLISLLLNLCNLYVVTSSVLNSSVSVASPTITISGPSNVSSLTTATNTPQNVSSALAFPTMPKFSHPVGQYTARMTGIFVQPGTSWPGDHLSGWARPTVRHNATSTPLPTGATVFSLTTANTTSQNVSSAPTLHTKPAWITSFLGMLTRHLPTGSSLATAKPAPQIVASAPTHHTASARVTRLLWWVTERFGHCTQSSCPPVRHHARPTHAPYPRGPDSFNGFPPWGPPCNTTLEHLATMHMGPVTVYESTATTTASVDCEGCALVQKTVVIGNGPVVFDVPATVTEEATTKTVVACSPTFFM